MKIAQNFLLILAIAMAIFIAVVLWIRVIPLTQAESEYTLVVTGTDGCPCAFEVWKDNKIVHQIDNCNE